MNLRLLLTTIVSHFLLLNASCQVADSNAVSNEEFRQILREKDVVILDVRTTEEFKDGHIENAIHTDVLQAEAFRKYISTLPKDKTYLLYCRSGKRSANALRIMNETGFINVKHLQNGVTGWDGPVIK